jgi:hypothetical protein
MGPRFRGDDVEWLTRNCRPRKDRALPQIGRDVVKIRGMDGVAHFRRAGDIRARSQRETRKADERHVI